MTIFSHRETAKHSYVLTKRQTNRKLRFYAKRHDIPISLKISRCKYRRISVHFLKNHCSNKSSVSMLVTCIFLAFSPPSLELQFSRHREMSSWRQERTISPQLQSHVWAMSNFPNIKGKREFAMYINKLKQANLQM